MFKVGAFCALISLLWLSPSILSSNTLGAKPGCNESCGNVSVPYPFGIGLDGDCSYDETYNINCNDTYYDPPKPFLGNGSIEVKEISISGLMRVESAVAWQYYPGGRSEKTIDYVNSWTKLKTKPMVFSESKNKFTVIGCDDVGYFYGTLGRSSRSGCIVGCSEPEDVLNGSCLGMGFCQTSIPRGLKNFEIYLSSYSKHAKVRKFNPYSYAFLADKDKFRFNVADLNDPAFLNRTQENVPVVIDWFIGMNQSCHEAKRNHSGYACQSNTNCTDFEAGSSRGYRCNCLPGYEGNPYLSPGCTDIDECATDSSNECSDICTNIPGSYICSCPKGHRGDGWKNGTRCIRNPSPSGIRLSLVISSILGSTLLVPVGWWLYTIFKKTRIIKQRAKYFNKNGGLFLQQQMSSNEGIIERTKFFTINELEKATDHFSESRILGQGGHGTVYKGMLGEGRLVAVKKSKIVDESEQGEFINEVIILSQVNHRNIVKLIGCCLESEVPLLVFEFIPNGTLFKHVHYPSEEFAITWRMRQKIALDSAAAIVYLHYSSCVPILHRDIKSSNILLDDKYRAKLSDFGTSRNVATDQTHVTTRVMGTLGYLDPEYFQSSQFTEKSDVYSFGVVLVELLTGQKAIRAITETNRSLVAWFLSHMEDSTLLDIVDSQVLREGLKEDIFKMADLAKRCLNLDGKRRPTMKEVLRVLEIEEPSQVDSPQIHEKKIGPEFQQGLEETTNSLYSYDISTFSTFYLENSSSTSAEVSLLFSNL